MNQPAKQQSRKLTPRDIPAYLQTDAGQAKIRKYAPDDVTNDDIRRTGLWLLNNGPDKLHKCDVGQIIEAILQAFHDGIDLTRGEGHLVPYPPAVDYRIDYKGLVRLAEEGTDLTVDADVVRENDEFRKWRDNEGLHIYHEPAAFHGGEELGVYCVVYEDGGVRKVETMTPDELKTVAEQSGNPYNDEWSQAWKDYTWEMAKKSVTRRALKTIDTRPAVDKALTREARQTFREIEGGQEGADAEIVDDTPQTTEQLDAALEGAAQTESGPPDSDEADTTDPTPDDTAEADDAPPSPEERLKSARRSTSQYLRNAAISESEREAFKELLRETGVWEDPDVLEDHCEQLADADDRAAKVRGALEDDWDASDDGWTIEGLRGEGDQLDEVIAKFEDWTDDEREVRACLEQLADEKECEVTYLPNVDLYRFCQKSGASLSQWVNLATDEIPH